LGFDISLTKRIRLAGVDTPESRTADANEKKYGLESKEWLKKRCENAKNILIKTELPDSTEKYGRIIGHLFINGEETSLNNQMIAEGYAWEYSGGTKVKDFEKLKQIRKSKGTLVE
jgi:micrococcal nuclease